MIEVQEAVKIIEDSVLHLPSVKIPIEKALGRVLRQDVFADADFPPFNRVMMDGIALRFKDFEDGKRDFKIIGIQAAGSPQMKLNGSGNCLEVMTGAVAPASADVVVPYEDVEIDSENNMATVQLDQFQKWKNIHIKGSDKKKGELLIETGKLIDSPEIAVAASTGYTELAVTKNPSIAIISTGDELVEINQKPLPHQIRRSNVHAIATELKRFGIKSNLFHFNDEKVVLENELKKVIKSHEILIMSGGVSKGKFDFVPETLEKLGIRERFHRIKQKPGKPFWFGVGENRKVVFAFPGNPVSTFLCYHKYFVPWLKKSLGNYEVNIQKAILSENFNTATRLTYFLQVSTSINEKGQLMAIPKIGQGSGDHANLLISNAFLELPGDTFSFKKGEVFNLISFRNT